MLRGETTDCFLDERIDIREALLQKGDVAALGEIGDASKGNVDALEERRFLFRDRNQGCKTMIRRYLFFGGRQAGAAILRFLMTETQARNLRVSEAEKRVVVAFGNLDRSGELALDNCSVRVVLKFGGIILAVRVVVDSLIRDPRERDACIVLQGLPRPQAFFDLLGKHRGIARLLERFLRHLPGDLVISVAVRAPADKHGSDGERPYHADDTDNITQNAIVAPLIQGLFFCFGKTVVADACPELLRTIVAIRSEELFRAHEAKGIEVV